MDTGQGLDPSSDAGVLGYLQTLVDGFVREGLGIRDIARRFDAYIADVQATQQGDRQLGAKITRLNRLIDQVLNRSFTYQPAFTPAPGPTRTKTELEIGLVQLRAALRRILENARTMSENAGGYQDKYLVQLHYLVNNRSDDPSIPVQMRGLLINLLQKENLPVLVSVDPAAPKQIEYAIDLAMEDYIPAFRHNIMFNRYYRDGQEKLLRMHLGSMLNRYMEVRNVRDNADALWNDLLKLIRKENLGFIYAGGDEVSRVIDDEINKAIARQEGL